MRKYLYSKNDKRIKKRFLLFPVSINKELRWLEFAIWEEQKLSDDFLDRYWEKTRWIN